MATEGGGAYIKLYRSLRDHWMWKMKPFSPGQAWVDLLMRANWREGSIPHPSKIGPTKLQPGELICSKRALAVTWGWDRKRVDRFINAATNDAMIVATNDATHTRIKILNWNKLQKTYLLGGATQGPPMPGGCPNERAVFNKNAPTDAPTNAATHQGRNMLSSGGLHETRPLGGATNGATDGAKVGAKVGATLGPPSPPIQEGKEGEEGKKDKNTLPLASPTPSDPILFEQADKRVEGGASASPAGTPEQGPEAEVERQLLQLAQRQKIIGRQDTLRSYLRGWIATAGAARVQAVLSSPTVVGRAILEIHKQHFDGTFKVSTSDSLRARARPDCPRCRGTGVDRSQYSPGSGKFSSCDCVKLGVKL